MSDDEVMSHESWGVMMSEVMSYNHTWCEVIIGPLIYIVWPAGQVYSSSPKGRVWGEATSNRKGKGFACSRVFTNPYLSSRCWKSIALSSESVCGRWPGQGFVSHAASAQLYDVGGWIFCLQTSSLLSSQFTLFGTVGYRPLKAQDSDSRQTKAVFFIFYLWHFIYLSVSVVYDYFIFI